MVLLAITFGASLSHAQQKYVFGINFWAIDTRDSLNNLATLFDDSMKCIYQGGGIDSLNMNWVHRTTGNFVASSNAIGKYSSAQRMRYEALPLWDTLSSTDTLTKYYFGYHSSADTGYNSTNLINHQQKPFDHWQINSSGTHSDSVVINANQFANEWYGDSYPWRIAVGLQIQTPNPADTHAIIEIHAIHANSADSTLETLTYGIPWDSVITPNTDHVFFSAPLSFSHAFNKYDYINLEVHSKRYTTVRLSFVCIMDTVAFNFTAPVDLDQTLDTTAMHAAKLAIIADTNTLADSMPSRITCYYLQDEPTYSQGAGMALVNKTLGYRGNCEVQWYNFDPQRYITQVQPKFFWSAFGGIRNSQHTCMYTDTTAAWEYISSGSYYVCPGGYFINGRGPSYVNAKATETSTSYSVASTTPFDPELRSDTYTMNTGGFDTTQAGYRLLTADTLPGGWWANMFLDVSLDTISGIYLDGVPGYPEQIQLNSNLAISEGCKGMMYYTNINAKFDSIVNTGFVDHNGSFASDSELHGPHVMPTMSRRDCLWAIRYHRWLDSTAKILLNKKLRGIFSRHSDYPVIVNHIGNIFVNTDSDHTSYPNLKAWPDSSHIYNDSSWLHYSKQYYPGDTAYTYKALPDSIAWIIYSCWSADTTAITTLNPGFLSCTNIWTDPRDLLCRWQNDADTGTFVRRGERMITTKLKMDTTVDKWWRVTDVASKWDSVIAYNGSFKRHYNPAEMRIYKIEPAYSVDAGGAGETVWNNGRRSDFNGGYYHVTFKQNNHVQYTRSDACSVGDDPLAGFAPETQIDIGVDSAKHPSIRSYNDGLSGGIGDTSVAIIYEGRKSHTSPTWDSIYILLAFNPDNGTDSVSGVPIWRTDTIYSFAKDSYYDANYEATPVLTPFKIVNSIGTVDSIIGFTCAWSEGNGGIGMRTFSSYASVDTPKLGDVIHIDNGVPAQFATFPTVSSRAMNGSLTQGDTADLGYEIDSAGQSQIYYRTIYLEGVKAGGTYKVQLTAEPREYVSVGIGCLDKHPNIDDSRILPTTTIDYVPRLVWEGYVPDGVNGAGLAVTGTDVFSAARVAGHWEDYAMFRSKESSNLHPSVRVYFSDSTVFQIPYSYKIQAASGPMLQTPKIWSSPSHITQYHVQPSIVSWYTSSNRLMTVQTKDGVLPSFRQYWPAFGFPTPSIFGDASWEFGHWRDSGQTPTLEINGRDTIAFANQRELFLTHDGQHERIPIVSSHVVDDSSEQYGQTQTFKFGSCGGVPGISTFAGAMAVPGGGVPPGNNYLLYFHSYAVSSSPGIALGTDTFSITPFSDTIKYIFQLVAFDSANTRAWVDTTGAFIKMTLAVRNARTGNIVKLLDTITYDYLNYHYRADTGKITIDSIAVDSIYITVSDTMAHITDPITSGFSVTREYALPSDTGGGFGKTINHNLLASAVNNGSMLQAYPNPFMPAVNVAYDISAIDAGYPVTVSVYDRLGRQIAMLVNSIQTAGSHIAQFDGSALNLPTGNYFLKITTQSQTITKIIAYIK